MAERLSVQLAPLGLDDVPHMATIFTSCFETDPLYARAIGFDSRQLYRFMTILGKLVLPSPGALALGAMETDRMVMAALGAPCDWEPNFFRHPWMIPVSFSAFGPRKLWKLLGALRDSNHHAPSQKNWMHLLYFGGSPESRSKGYGGQLLQRFIDDARQGGFRAIYLETLTDNEGAIRFYRYHGFEPSKEVFLRDIPHQQMVCPL